VHANEAKDYASFAFTQSHAKDKRDDRRGGTREKWPVKHPRRAIVRGGIAILCTECQSAGKRSTSDEFFRIWRACETKISRFRITNRIEQGTSRENKRDLDKFPF